MILFNSYHRRIIQNQQKTSILVHNTLILNFMTYNYCENLIISDLQLNDYVFYL
jgi:hypothetical protein